MMKMTEKKPAYLIEFEREIREGKRGIWPQWLPEMGNAIEFEDFHKGTLSGEIEDARVIRPPEGVYFGKEAPWDPHPWCYGWRENKLVYTRSDPKETNKLLKDSLSDDTN